MVSPKVPAKIYIPDGTAMGSPSKGAKTCTDRKRIHNSPSPPISRKKSKSSSEKPSKHSKRSRNQLDIPPQDDDDDVKKIVREEREKIEKLLAKNISLHGFVPPYNVSMSEDKVLSLSFRMPSTDQVQKLLVDVIMRLPQKGGSHNLYQRMFIGACSSSPCVLRISKRKREDIDQLKESKKKLFYDGAFSVAFMESSPEITVIEFSKQGRFSRKEAEAVASAIDIASTTIKSNTVSSKTLGPGSLVKTMDKTSQVKIVDDLKSMGVRVCEPIETRTVPTSKGGISWENLAGYERQKRKIEDTIVLALLSPEVYDTIARGTRTVFEPNRPRAVLFEGPPGTGKTSFARVIANQASVPLLHVPLEAVLSKYFGESELLLGKVFSLANKLPSGALIFLDEVDSLAVDRDNMDNEASRRILSVLLRQIDGFDQDKKVIVIAATNRKEDLDSALIRMSGRDIKDFCQAAERQWASKIIRGADGLKLGDLPPVDEYLDCAKERSEAMSQVAIKRALTQESKKWRR